MQKLIIGLIGEKLSGKDEVAKYVVAKQNAFHIKFSHLLDEILDVLNLPKTRRNEIDLGLGLRQIFGSDVLYLGLKQRIETSNAQVVVINGIRMDEFDKIVEDLKAKLNGPFGNVLKVLK
jgi:ABC-type antimicrobial peptide transport system ATPase subunit